MIKSAADKRAAVDPGEIRTEELAEVGVSVAALARALDVPQSRPHAA